MKLKKTHSKSSKQWLKRQQNDVYTKKSKSEGYRSRAAFKLLEIQEKDHLIQNGMTVVELGAAPGGWSQVVCECAKEVKLFAIDLLPMEPLPNVEFILGDFQTEEVLNQVLNSLKNQKVDLVISDMAPKLSGIGSVDQPRAIYLGEVALDFALKTLVPGGSFLVKLFQGEGFDAFVSDVRQYFSKVIIRKPKASRTESRETYVLAKGFKPMS